MFYIFSKNGDLLYRCNEAVNEDDLKTRDEFCIEHNEIEEDKLISANITTKKMIVKDRVQLLDEIKKQKLQHLKNVTQQLVNTAVKVSNTPDFERQTWQMQAEEAIAYQEDDSASTPTLDVIAQSRGVDRIFLINKAYAKAMQYRQLTAYVAGKRQAIEQQIQSANTLEALDAISLEISIQTSEQ